MITKWILMEYQLEKNWLHKRRLKFLFLKNQEILKISPQTDVVQMFDFFNIFFL